MPPSTVHAFAGSERFSVLGFVGAGGMGTVYEVFDRERGERVALKQLRGGDPTRLYLFKQEFRSLTELAHPNLVSLYELFVENEQWCFTMEMLEKATDFRQWVQGPDSPGESAPDRDTSDSSERSTIVKLSENPLADTVAGEAADTLGPPEDTGSRRPAGFLDEARLRAALKQLVEGVMALHAAGLLHRDLKPENVLVTPDGRVRLLDFGLVADLKIDTTEPGLPAPGDPYRTSSEAPTSGTTSPGRTRRIYEATDEHVAGTIHYMSPEQALARTLTPASDWYSVGVMLYESLTGMKPYAGTAGEVLAAKNRLEPSPPSAVADGVPADLERLCMALLQRDPEARPTGLEVFAVLAGGTEPAASATDGLAAWDLDAPPFVGRHEQISTLLRAFEKSRAGRVVVCRVHGRSGAGKSTLLGHVQDIFAQGEVVILSGRCYEQESVPYKAWDSLCDSLYRYLARLPDAAVDRLLPEHVAALARVFPVLKRLHSVADAGASGGDGTDLRELRRLGFAALGQLLARIGEGQPLVLAIDDLHWGDVDSAQLLADLLETPGMARLLVLLAYRSEYAGRSACLDALAAAEKAAGPEVEWNDVEVAAMSEGETLELARTLLGPDRSDAPALAERIRRESGGNAFFIYELARHARAGMSLESGLDFDAFLWARIQRLEEDQRRLLEMVAVAGQPIRMRDAAQACEFSFLAHPVVAALRSARFARMSGPALDDDIECFHDRVRETILARLGSDVLRRDHERLATVLEENGRAEPQTIAVHLQHSQPERASVYFEKAAEGALRVLAFDRAEEYYSAAARLAGSGLEKARLQEKLIHFYTDMARFRDSYDLGREATAAFGVKLPAKFNPPAFLADLAMARLRMGFRKVADIVHLQEMKDERRMGAVRLIAATAKAAFQVRPELCVAICTKAVNLCLRYGNTAEAAIPYMVFGAIFLGGVLGRYATGYEFGQLSLALVDRFQNRKQRAEVHFVVGYFATSWLRPASEAEALWRETRVVGLETADLFHTGCALAGTAQSLLMRGAPLDEVRNEAESHLDWLERVGLREPAGCVRAVRQTVRCLRGLTSSAASFDDDGFEEASFVEEIEGFGSRHFAHFYFVDKMLALYLWGEYERAWDVAERSAGYLKDSQGMLHGAEHVFLRGLIAAALAGPGPGGGRLEGVVKKARRRFARWAARCPANFSHKHRLLEAEAARLAGDLDGARARYDAAVEAARTYGYLQVLGVANQRAAQVLDRGGDGESAARYRQAAREAWLRWGTNPLADAVESRASADRRVTGSIPGEARSR